MSREDSENNIDVTAILEKLKLSANQESHASIFFIDPSKNNFAKLELDDKYYPFACELINYLKEHKLSTVANYYESRIVSKTSAGIKTHTIFCDQILHPHALMPKHLRPQETLEMIAKPTTALTQTQHNEYGSVSDAKHEIAIEEETTEFVFSTPGFFSENSNEFFDKKHYRRFIKTARLMTLLFCGFGMAALTGSIIYAAKYSAKEPLAIILLGIFFGLCCCVAGYKPTNYHACYKLSDKQMQTVYQRQLENEYSAINEALQDLIDHHSDALSQVATRNSANIQAKLEDIYNPIEEATCAQLCCGQNP
ncbi:MAG: hypothetical protein K0U12_03845 [Gammaproteobacteria bacterium]|nr:hypothetical protein [Gammaproteobacteria bacterium]